MNKIELEKLINEGLSTYKIADVTGKAPSTIRYWLCKYELGTKRVFKCSRCGETDPSKFTKGRYNSCRRCRAATQTHSNKRQKIKSVKYKGSKCVRCGYSKCIAALDFHHRDPKEKDPNWRRMRNWAFEKVKEELDKCDLVCRNCHAEIHYG